MLGPLFDLYPNNWALSEHYRRYLHMNVENEENLFTPDPLYYNNIVRKLLDG